MPGKSAVLPIASMLALLVFAFGLLACGGDDEAASESAAAAEEAAADGQFVLVYDEETISDYNEPIFELVRESGNFEAAVETMNDNVRLPEDIEIYVGEDLPEELAGGPAYFYDETDQAIIFPPDFMTEAAILLYEHDDDGQGGFTSRHFTLDDAVLGAMLFILYHEIGHALIHQLDLPTTGREEDAVDGLAALISTSDPEHSVLPSLSASMLFDAYAELGGEPSLRDYAGEHSLDRQRVFQFFCYIVGSDPELFSEDLVGPGLLPRDRAEACPAEWEQTAYAWFTLLEPHLKEGSDFAQQTEQPESE